MRVIDGSTERVVDGGSMRIVNGGVVKVADGSAVHVGGASGKRVHWSRLRSALKRIGWSARNRINYDALTVNRQIAYRI